MNTVEGRKIVITMVTKCGIVHRELGLAGLTLNIRQRIITIER